MRRFPTLLAVVLAATASPRVPTPTPVFELRRTAAASSAVALKANPLFILVIGSDVRSGDPAAGRADSLHIVAVNTNTGRATIIGIPRDTWVPIPGKGMSKINDSLVAGGPAKVVETVSAFSGLPIHYWALTDFSRFIAMTDRLGGLDVDVPYDMFEPFSGANFQAGRHHMAGDSLLAFARDRKGSVPGGDIGRSENQGRVLLAALSKFRTDTASALAVYGYLQALRDFVVSDVGAGEVLRLAYAARRVDPAAVANVVIPVTLGTVGAASVVFAGPEAQAVFAAVRDDAVL